MSSSSACDVTYLNARQVSQRYGNVSHMWLIRRLNDKSGFPRPVYLGRLRFWKLSELEDWERRRAARDDQSRSFGASQREEEELR